MNLLREEDEIEVSDALLNSPSPFSYISFNASDENLVIHQIDYFLLLLAIISIVLFFCQLLHNLLIL